jgi:hypothetical protein
VPERVWAAAEARASKKIAASRADLASLVKTTPCELAENLEHRVPQSS